MRILYFQIGNIFFIDLFLGGAFMTYGTDVLRFTGDNQENRTDPMVAVFPRITKCTFHKYGSSGKNCALNLGKQTSYDKCFDVIFVFRNVAEARCLVRIGSEYYQREDIHFLVVLVHYPGCIFGACSSVQSGHCGVAVGQGNHSQAPFSLCDVSRSFSACRKNPGAYLMT